MRVNNQNVGNSVQNAEAGAAKKTGQAAAADAKKQVKGTSASEPSGSASVEVSDRAREMSAAKEAATSAPDLRETKIAELKRRIAAKQYNVKPEEVAGKMVDEHLRTREIS